MRFRMMSAVWVLAGLLVLGGCGGVPHPGFAPMTPLPGDAHPAPVSFSVLKYTIPTGTAVGQWGENWCGLKSPIERGDLRGAIDKGDIQDTFHDTMQSEGYDVTGAPDLIFDEEIDDDLLRSEYRIAAEIIDARTDVCYRDDRTPLAVLLPGRGGFTGQLYLKIRWSVFDSLRRTSVYKTQTEGYARRTVPNPEGVSLLVTDAFAMAAHNLGADPQFQNLVVHGVRPPMPVNAAAAPLRPRRFDPSAPLVLPNMTLSKAPFVAHADAVRTAAVLVQGGIGHGSGFFISRQGDIVTAAHVVGDALHVRIKLSDRGEAYIAEVVRSDKARDVALLRLMDPPSFVPTVLPVRTAWPGIGETVYAIGAPRDTRLQDSVTSGIVSAIRTEFNVLGTRQDYIQSDVTTQKGNSGGPLVDRNGNLIGLTDAGAMNNDYSVGLNYFVPIGEALSALGITLQ